MKCIEQADQREGFFEVVAKTPRSEAAVMTLRPGERSGDAESRHRGDQWLYAVSGRGVARFQDREVNLEPGTLLLIEAGEAHQIRAVGDEPLRTLNIYAPVVY